MTTPTKLPIPSNNLLDARFNFEKLDQIVNGDANYYLDRFGKQRLTSAGLEDLARRLSEDYESTLSNQDGYKKMGMVSDFTTLRTIAPAIEGQRILLRSVDNGSNNGSGEFIGHLGSGGVDDGVNIAVGSNFYWERLSTDFVKSSSIGDYARINSFISAGNKKITVDADLSGWLNVKSNTTITFNPLCRLIPDTDDKVGISIRGAAPTSYVNLVTDALGIDGSITTTNDVFNIGDWLEIRSNKVLPGANFYQVKQSVLRKVLRKTQNGNGTWTYRLHSSLGYNFNVSDGASAGVATVLENIVIDGANLNKDNFTNIFTIGINCYYVYNLTIKNINLFGTKVKDSASDTPGRSGIKLYNCVNVRIDNVNASYIGWYGVEVMGCSENVDVNRLYGVDCRHTVSMNWIESGDLYGGPMWVSIRNSASHAARLSGFDTHDLGKGIAFINCQSFDSGDDGFQVRAMDTVLIDCHAEGSTLDGFGGATGAKNSKLVNCSFNYNVRYGINLGYEGGIVINCDVDNNGYMGICTIGGLIQGGSVTNNYPAAIDIGAGFNTTQADLKIDGVRMPSSTIQTKILSFAGDAVAANNKPELVRMENCYVPGYGRDWARLVSFTVQPLPPVLNNNLLTSSLTAPGKISGQIQLSAGTATVTTTEVFSQLGSGANVLKYSSQIKLKPIARSANIGAHYVSVINNGTSFVINSTNTSDGSTIYWEITL